MPFDLEQYWTFPSNNGGQISGIADSGIETFKGTPIKSLAREICQNSLDASISPDTPVRIEVKPHMTKVTCFLMPTLKKI